MLLVDSRKRESKEEILLTIATLQDNSRSKIVLMKRPIDVLCFFF